MRTAFQRELERMARKEKQQIGAAWFFLAVITGLTWWVLIALILKFRWLWP